MSGVATDGGRNREPMGARGGGTEPNRPGATVRLLAARGGGDSGAGSAGALPALAKRGEHAPARRPIPIDRARRPLGGLTERERRILRIRFAARRGFPTYSEVACRLQLPVWTVRQVEAVALRKLTQRLRGSRPAAALSTAPPATGNDPWGATGGSNGGS